MRRPLAMTLLAPCRVAVVFVLAFSIVNSAAAMAQAPAGPGEARLALPPQIELARLVDLAAQRLSINIDYDPSVLPAQQVTLRIGDPVSNDELWVLVNRLLATRGLATVRMPGKTAYSVVRLADASGLGELRVDAGAESGVGLGPPAGFQTAVVQVRYRAVKDVTDILSKLASKPAGSVTPLADTGLLVIADATPRLEQMLELLRSLDTPASPVVVEEIAIVNSRSAALATLAAQVAAKRDLQSGRKAPGEIIAVPDQQRVLIVAPRDAIESWRSLVAELDRREQVETRVYTPRGFTGREVAKLIEDLVKGASPDERWRLVVDELTGTVVISATAAQHEQIRELLDRLDATPGVGKRPVRHFVIKNRPAKEIQSILSELHKAGTLAAGVDGGPPPEPALRAPSGTVPPPTSPPTPPVITSGSSVIGSAAATSAAPAAPSAVPATTAMPSASAPPPGATSPNLRGVSESLAITVDESTNTLIVMAESRVLAQIQALLPALDVRQAQVSLEVLIVSLNDSQTLDLGVELEKLTKSGDTRIRLSSLFGLGTRGSGGDRGVGDGSGFTAFVLNPGDFSIVVRALETINKGRSLSMPRLLVSNNQQATLDSTLDQPFTTTSQPTSGGVLTSFGGSSQAGTQVTLKPQIAEGDHLRLEYSVSLSAFVGAAAGPNVPPPKQQNKIASAATLPDGYTVAVGGIEVASDGQGTSQVPGLGRIPILGEAFKNRSKTQGRSRFFVFIRSTILRHGGFEDLKFISGQDAAAAGVNDGFPVVEPRLIR